MQYCGEPPWPRGNVLGLRPPIKYSDKSLKGFGWNNVGPASQTMAQPYVSIGPMYRVIWCFWRRDEKRHPHNNAAVRKHGTITQCCFNVGPASKTVGQHWNSIGWMPWVCRKNTADPVMDECWASVVDDWPALNQQWAATLAQHWTGIWLVGLCPLYEVHRRQVLNECWPARRWWWEEYT